MLHSTISSNIEKHERRRRWHDRRMMSDRRIQERLNHTDDDCRDNVPRRESDVIGTGVEGELWWSGDQRFL